MPHLTHCIILTSLNRQLNGHTTCQQSSKESTLLLKPYKCNLWSVAPVTHAAKSGIPNCSIRDFMGWYSQCKLHSPNVADIKFMDSVSTKYYTNELGMRFRELCDWKPVSTIDSPSLIWGLCSSVLQGFCVYHRLKIWHRLHAFIVNTTAGVSLWQITPNDYISEMCIDNWGAPYLL